MSTINEQEQRDICCDALVRIAPSLGWHYTEDGTTMCLPYITDPDGKTKWRVNHCPSCGKDISNLFLAKETLPFCEPMRNIR